MRSCLFNSIRLTLVLSAALFCGTSFAQNLVLNPSFESVNVGSLQCSWYTSAAQFNSAINNWTCPTGGSTDVFNTALATSCYCSPFSTNASSPGQQAPRTGNGYCNITVYGSGGCTPYREYIQGQLSSALVVGQSYEVEMWVSLADKMSVGTNNLGIKFSANPYSSGSMCVYSTTPDLNYTGPIILDKNNWVQILFCYTPTVAGLDNFIIGNFYSDAATTTAPASGNTSQSTIRYFVEDVRIQAVTTTPANAGNNGTVNICPGGSSVNLFSSLGGTPATNGTWSGPSTLTGGYLGTFNPAVNTAGVYTYTVSGGSSVCGAGGSPATATVTVTLNPTSNATITPAGPFCITDGAVTLSAASPGGTWSGSGITDPVNGVFNPAIAGSGTIPITYTIPGSCGSSHTLSIQVNPLANANFTATSPICASSPAQTFTPTTPGGTWSGTGITNSVSGIFDPAVSGAGSFPVTYTIGGSCGNSQTQTIQVNPMADASINPAGPFCQNGLPQQLTALNAGGTWSGTGIINAANGMFDPQVSGVGSFTVSYTIAGPCGDTKTAVIDVLPLADASINPAGPFCETAGGQSLSAVTPGGTWSGTGITDAVNGIFDPAMTGPGNHTITYTLAGTCPSAQTQTIQVIAQANAGFSAPSPLCAADAAQTLTPITPGGTWSGTGITDAVNGIFDPASSGVGNFPVTYTIGGSCGNSLTQSIQVNPMADASINPAGPFCQDELTQQLTALNAGGTWSGTGIIDAVNGLFDPQTAGIGTFNITYTIAGQCGDTKTIVIDVLQTADATINPAGPFCESDAGQSLSAVTSGGVWSGAGITDPDNGIFDPAIAGAGTHTITYTLGGTCGNSQNISITVEPTAMASIVASGPHCFGSAPVTLSASGATGTWSGQGITDPVNGIFDPAAAGAGIHQITFQSNDLCPIIATTQIEVLTPLTVQASTDVTICEGESTTLSVSGTGGNGNYSYIWLDGNGNQVGSGSSIVVSPTQTSNYTVTLNDGCTQPVATDFVTVNVNPLPAISILPAGITGCAPMEVVFENTSAQAGNQCSWTFGDGGSSGSCGPVTHTYTQTGCFDVTLTVTLNGCSNTQTFPDLVCLISYPVAAFSYSPELAQEFNPEYQFDNNSINADSYHWSFGDGESSSEENPTHVYPSSIAEYDVCLNVFNEYGCPDTVCKTVSIAEGLVYYIPNSFTPDGDEFNNLFHPVFTAGFDPYDFEFYIYNRWGELIWESHDASAGWDGTYNNQPVQEGTYVWKVYFKRSSNDEKFTRTGHVTVLR